MLDIMIGNPTASELMALRLVAEGQLQVEIARREGVGTSAINRRLMNVRRKFGARTLEQAMVIAVRRGLV